MKIFTWINGKKGIWETEGQETFTNNKTYEILPNLRFFNFSANDQFPTNTKIGKTKMLSRDSS